VKDGATLNLAGGMSRPAGLPGHFFQPTMLTDVRHGSVATREEIFGPVAVDHYVADADEAIRFANDSERAGRFDFTPGISQQRCARWNRSRRVPFWIQRSLDRQ